MLQGEISPQTFEEWGYSEGGYRQAMRRGADALAARLPRFDPLRGNPGYEALIRRLKLMS